MAPASPAPAELKELEAAASALDGEGPEAVLRWASERYGDGLTMACSFGGTSGMALVDMASKLGLPIEVFFLDTGFLFPETSALVGEVEAAVSWRRPPSTARRSRSPSPAKRRRGRSLALPQGKNRQRPADSVTGPHPQRPRDFVAFSTVTRYL